MKFTFDLLNVPSSVFIYRDVTDNLNHVLSVREITTVDLKDRVTSSSTFLIALPGVYIPHDTAKGENIITAVLAAPSEEDILMRHNLVIQIMLSKAIACDYIVWEALNKCLPLKKSKIRWIDITGCSLMGTFGFPRTIDKQETVIYYFGNPKGSFASFLEGSLIIRDNLNCTKIEYLDPYSFPCGDIDYTKQTIAVTPFSHSRAFMDTLVNFFDFTLYPVTGDNGNHISALDSRGATSILTNVANIERLGAGRQQQTVSAWDDMFFNVRTMVKSTVDIPYKRATYDDLLIRLFHEINRSGF